MRIGKYGIVLQAGSYPKDIHEELLLPWDYLEARKLPGVIAVMVAPCMERGSYAESLEILGVDVNEIEIRVSRRKWLEGDTPERPHVATVRHLIDTKHTARPI